MIRLYILSALLFGRTLFLAQEPKFIQRELGNDFVGTTINVMLQDHQCMLWLGTDKGLIRYDGTESYTISLNTNSITDTVTALFEDKMMRIWVGTESGKIYYLDNMRKAHFFDIEESHPRKKITSILQDQQGQIWFSTYGEGVYVYTGSRLFNFNTDDHLTDNDIYCMIASPKGEIWLGTDDGINICTFDNEMKHVDSIELADGLPDQIITALKADAYGNVWIGTFEAGIAYFDALQKKITIPFTTPGLEEITTFEIFDKDELWIGSKSGGVWLYLPESGVSKKVVNLKSIDGVSFILSDVEGNIWIATHKGILFSAFRLFESLSTDVGEIQALYFDHSDKLWIGTMNGLYRLDEYKDAVSKFVRIAPEVDFNITDILEDEFNNLWIATLDKGLFIYTPSTGKVKTFKEALPVLGTSIMSIDKTKDRIWIAALQAVVYYPTGKNIANESEIHFQMLEDTIQSIMHFVLQVYVDSKDRAWFATQGNGVCCIDHGKFNHYNGNDSLTIKTVNSICEDYRGHLWFTTPDFGLIEFDDNAYRPLDLTKGLVSLEVASISSAKQGDILISRKNGVDLMDPVKRHFMYYSSEIGAEEFEPDLNAVTSDSRGNIYIGGNNKILKYYGANDTFSIDPRTQLTLVRVNQEPIDFITKHSFNYNQNYIIFDFIGLWYVSPHSVKYEYKLEGYDKEPKTSKDNEASYSKLPPGDYVFHVKATENRFFYDEPEASYSFTIEKPIWSQFWFIGLISVVGGLMIYLGIKSRDRRIERQALIKKEMLESQLQALKAQINPHFLFNSFNTLITIIDENVLKPDVAIEYVEKLSDFFRSILLYREQEMISLEEEWALVQNFGYLLEKRYGSMLHLHLDPPIKNALIVPLTLQMLVENAVKHNVITKELPLSVYISIDRDDYITVKNNLQPKAKTEPSTKFGLQSIVKRYQILSDRKVVIESDHHSFKVRIPLIKKSKE